MKQLIAILLICLYLFNLAGYSLLFRYFIHQSDRRFTQQIDKNNYRDAELVEISIPLHLPYMRNNIGFERADGAVRYNGIEYNYVKRRVYNDTLYILCLPNRQRMNLTRAQTNYAGEVNDFNINKKEKESNAKKSGFSAEYNHSITQYSFALPRTIPGRPIHGLSIPLPAANGNIPEHPPQPVS